MTHGRHVRVEIGEAARRCGAASSGCDCCAEMLQRRGRAASSAFSRARTIFIIAMRGPANTSVQPGSTSTSVARRGRSPRQARAGRCRRGRPSSPAHRRDRRAGRKIDLAGIGGMGAHHAEQEGAIRALAARPCAKQFRIAAVGKAPVAPRHEAREIGLEIRPAQRRRRSIATRRMQQDAAVPQRRLGARSFVEMRIDLGAPLVARTRHGRAARSADRAARRCGDVNHRVRRRKRPRPRQASIVAFASPRPRRR